MQTALRPRKTSSHIVQLFGSLTARETKAAKDVFEVTESRCDSQQPAFTDDVSATSGHQAGDASFAQPINKDQCCKSDTLSKMGKIKRKSMQEMRLVQNTTVVVKGLLFIRSIVIYSQAAISYCVLQQLKVNSHFLMFRKLFECEGNNTLVNLF